MTEAIAFLLGNWWRTAALALLLVAGGQAAWINHQSAKIDLMQSKAKTQAALIVAQHATLVAAQATVTTKVVTEYVDRIKVIHERGQTIVKEVPIYVPADLPVLPGSVRVFHDAAAQGVIPDPAQIANAAPVTPQDLAATVASNYGTCHETEAQLVSLQQWVSEQAGVK